MLVDEPGDSQSVKLLAQTFWPTEATAALEASNVIRVRVSPDDRAVQPYFVRKPPSILLLDSDGKVVTRREGIVDKGDFTDRFLKGLDAAAVPTSSQTALRPPSIASSVPAEPTRPATLGGATACGARL